MIVTCERCTAQFQLDESRLPKSGARVRCSRCKHAFLVKPPGGSTEDAIHGIAREAAESAGTPDVTQDLPAESIAGSGDDESDWQFNDDRSRPPSNDTSPFGSLALDETPEVARESSPEELGSPGEWDIFDALAAPQAPASAAAPPVLQRRSSDIPRGRAAKEVLDDGDGLPLWLRRAAATAGWIATTSLCAVALLRALGHAPPAPVAWPQPAPGVALEQVRGRWLDNAQLGRIYVVSGRVRNTGSAWVTLPLLVLELRDAQGRPLGAPIPLASPDAPEKLRIGGVAELATSVGTIGGPLRSGETREFATVAWPLPRDAARFAIRSASSAPGA